MSSSVSSYTLVALSRWAAIIAAVSRFILFFLLVLKFTCTTQKNIVDTTDHDTYLN